MRFDPVNTVKARIALATDAPCLTLSNLGIYNTPIVMTDPVITTDRNGMISITAPTSATVFYALGGNAPDTDFKRYTKPFDLSKGGLVSAYVLDTATGNKSDVIGAEFGIAKVKWKITGCSFANEGDASVQSLIDGDLNTMWHTHGKEGRQPPPHWVTIDLGETINVTGFTYMPRHDGCFVGLVDRYELYLSADGTDWHASAAKGEFHNIKNNPIEQVIKLPKSQKARFIKFKAIHALEANDCVAICEFGINSFIE